MSEGSPSKVVSTERWEALRREYRQRTAAQRARTAAPAARANETTGTTPQAATDS